MDRELSDTVKITPANDRIRFYNYEHADGSGILYLVNEGSQAYEGKVWVAPETMRDSLGKANSTRKIYGYDAWNNQIYPVILTASNEITIKIEARKSIIFMLDSAEYVSKLPLEETIEQRIINCKRKCVEIDKGRKRSRCRSIDYPTFIEEKEVNLPDCLAEEKPLFSGFVRYEKEITFSDTEMVFLEITNASEGVEVFVNGKRMISPKNEPMIQLIFYG